MNEKTATKSPDKPLDKTVGPIVRSAPPTPPPKSRRIPLSKVVFRVPVMIPGCDARTRLLVSGEAISEHISQAGAPVICPQAFYDPELNSIVVGEDLYPYDGTLVEKIVRAKAAKG